MAPVMPPVALEATEVSKRFGDVAALAGVSLEVARGECVALVGESGSGKSTLLKLCARLIDRDAGRITINGDDIDGFDPPHLRRRLGYVAQEGGLLPHWSIGRNVAMVPWLLGRGDATDVAARCLDLVGLPPADFAARWPHTLSGGQRQRVALARALAGNPLILLLDEPFGALDALTRADVQATFQRVRAASAVTAVIVTHDLREAFLLGDRVAVMREGRIEQVARPADLVERPATPYVAALLDRVRRTSGLLA
jgi:osmoprotectant transport system ATP-binding protein